MSDSVVEAITALREIAEELATLSGSLAEWERTHEPTEREYEKFMSEHEIGLWTKHVNEGAKLPPEKLRVRLAHESMPADLYGRYTAFMASRKRMEKRLDSLGKAANAQRSILSAEKVFVEVR